MKALNSRYKKYFTDRSFVISVMIGVIALVLSFVVNFYAGTYATETAGSPVKDIILSNIPAYDVDTIFIFGPLFLWLFVATLCLYEPKKLPFVLKSISLFIIVRSIFITLTHIGPFPDQINFVLDYPIYTTKVFNKFSFGGDLFFSAHTGLPFLMALIFWKNKVLGYLFTFLAIFFGIVVLMGHLHYSIDVLSAFFITYTIYHMSAFFFKKDKALFDEPSI